MFKADLRQLLWRTIATRSSSSGDLRAVADRVVNCGPRFTHLAGGVARSRARCLRRGLADEGVARCCRWRWGRHPFFARLDRAPLHLVEVKPHKSGTVLLRYEVRREPEATTTPVGPAYLGLCTAAIHSAPPPRLTPRAVPWVNCMGAWCLVLVVGASRRQYIYIYICRASALQASACLHADPPLPGQRELGGWRVIAQQPACSNLLCVSNPIARRGD